MNIKKKLFIIILFIVTLIYYLPIINLPLSPYDEAVILVGAEKVLNGQIPHKDFSSEYPAGQLYTLAALFKVFGTSVITERIYDLIVKSLLSLSVFLIIRSLSSNITALIGWIMSLIWLQHSSFPGYPVYPSILFIYISVYLLLLHIKEQKNYYVVLSAISIVVSVMFRHDIGGYAAIAITSVLMFRMIIRVQSRTPFILFVTTGISAIIFLFIYSFMNSSIGFIFNDLFVIPLSFREYQALPYPSLSRWNLPFFVFPLVLATGAITSIISIRRNKDDSAAYMVLFISIIGIFFLNQVKARSDAIHLLPVAITGILLSPILLYFLLIKLSLSTLQYKVICVLFIIFFGITLSKPIEVIVRLLSITNGFIVENVNPDIERAKHLNIDADIKDTLSYIKNNTSKNESIYVGVKNHDKFVFNDVIIYFLAGKDSATRYHTLNPGVHTTFKVQQEIVNEFKNNIPSLIVLGQRSSSEPNLSNVDTQVDLLDDYISNNYELKKRYGIYEIWMKKNKHSLNKQD